MTVHSSRPAFVLHAVAMALVVLLLGGAAAKADFAKGVRAYDAGDYKAAYEAWLPLARNDDPAAQRNIGLLFRKGLGVSQDFEAAARWYRRAAENGLVRAQVNLANMYLRGQGVPRDPQEARDWYARAALAGDAVGQFNLGLLHERGEGGVRSLPQAMGWYFLAGRSGHPEALRRLAVLVRTEEERRLKRREQARAAGSRTPPVGAGPAVAAVTGEADEKGAEGAPDGDDRNQTAKTESPAPKAVVAAPQTAAAGRIVAPAEAAKPDKNGKAVAGTEATASAGVAAKPDGRLKAADPAGGRDDRAGKGRGDEDRGDEDGSDKDRADGDRTDKDRAARDRTDENRAARDRAARDRTDENGAARDQTAESRAATDRSDDEGSEPAPSMARALLSGLITRLTTVEPARGTDRHDGITASAVERDEPDLDAAGNSVALAAGQEALREGRYGQARDFWLRPAQAGVAEARYRLGKLYAHPGFAQANPVDQLFWLSLAARQGHIGASIAKGELSRRLDESLRGEAEDRLKSWDEERSKL